MSYFERFPLTAYSFDGKSAILMADFLRRVAVPKSVKENLALYEFYDVRDGETPEMVADLFYRSPYLHWIILLTNEIIDPRLDWVMSQENLAKFCQAKYGDDNLYAVHHYEDSYGITVDSTFPGAYPVSNWEYEDRLNEKKRQIRILNSAVVTEFIKQFETEIAK